MGDVMNILSVIGFSVVFSAPMVIAVFILLERW